MAKAVVTFSQEHWPTIAILAGGDPNEIIWNSLTNELEVPDVNQANLDTVMTNFDPLTPVPMSWPTNPDLTALSAVSTLYWKDNAGTVIEMIQSEKNTADSDILDIEKNKLIVEIDAATTDRIHNELGFEWPPASGQFFSLSANAQTKWIGLMVGKDFLTYPLTVPSKTDYIFHDILDAAEAQNIYLTAMNVVRTEIKECTTTKENVRAALTVTDARTAADVYLTK